MPFSTETAAAAGRIGGSKTKDPATVRNKSIRLAVTQRELDMIDEKADAACLSRVELVVRAVKEYEPERRGEIMRALREMAKREVDKGGACK